VSRPPATPARPPFSRLVLLTWNIAMDVSVLLLVLF
jgi:hypothetical protein